MFFKIATENAGLVADTFPSTGFLESIHLRWCSVAIESLDGGPKEPSPNPGSTLYQMHDLRQHKFLVVIIYVMETLIIITTTKSCAVAEVRGYL